MGLMNDAWIRRMAAEQRMIEPFVDGQIRDDVISYGLSSYGYDIRVTDEFKIFTNVHSAVVDPEGTLRERDQAGIRTRAGESGGYQEGLEHSGEAALRSQGLTAMLPCSRRERDALLLIRLEVG